MVWNIQKYLALGEGIGSTHLPISHRLPSLQDAITSEKLFLPNRHSSFLQIIPRA